MTKRFVIWGISLLMSAVGGVIVVMAGISIVTSRPIFREQLQGSPYDFVSIADPEIAITLARYRSGGDAVLLLVLACNDQGVEGIPIEKALEFENSDPIQTFKAVGYEGIREIAESHSTKRVLIPWSELMLPIPTENLSRSHHFAIGLNFKKHADEVRVDGKPFVFPKFTEPTLFRSDISKQDCSHLDYEAEVAYVLLNNCSQGTCHLNYVGFVLANDVSNRWPILREHLKNLGKSEKDSKMGTHGYPDAKNNDGFLPIGPFLVIPRDFRSFSASVDLKLYLNGNLRQFGFLKQSIWGPERILLEIFRRQGWLYHKSNETFNLLDPNDESPLLPAGTLLLAGTPEGILFKRTNWWNPTLFLNPGDEVIIQSQYLGVIRNRVVD